MIEMSVEPNQRQIRAQIFSVVLIASAAAFTAVWLLPVAICNYVVPLIMLTMSILLLACGIAWQRKVMRQTQEKDSPTRMLTPPDQQEKTAKERDADGLG